MRAEDLARATNLTLAGSEISVALPQTALLAIARLVLELMVAEGRVPEASPLPEFMTVDEAAAYLRSDRQRVYDLVSARRLPKHKDGARLLLRRADLVAYLEGAR